MTQEVKRLSKRRFTPILRKNLFFIILLIFYFAFTLLNLTKLSIFNDESIYLDWAWSYTHMPGHLYDSLLDAKQPLMIWIFAVFENFFLDPLFAGRFVSVLFGAGTLIGIYNVSKRLFNQRVAYISALFYVVTPIFVFYNRQALMESAVMCVGVWSFYALMQVMQKSSVRAGAFLGFILGLGFFIKTSSLLFFFSASLMILYFAFKEKRLELVKSYTVSIFLFIFTNFLILTSSLFWQTFSSNSRYSYTPMELLLFPIISWIHKFLSSLEIGFLFMTPFVFIFGIIGVIKIFHGKEKDKGIFLIYFLIPLILEILSARTQSQRYLVSFLPFLLIPASYTINTLWEKTLWKKIIFIFSLTVPFMISTFLLLSPEQYINLFSKLSKQSEVSYIQGQTSGHGIKEVMNYIQTHKKSGMPTMVFFALNAGNPENAVNLYSQRDQDLYAMRIDKSFFPNIDTYDCLASKYPVFFITRNNELSGMDRYFLLEKSYKNTVGNYAVNIYIIQKNCKGKTFQLSDFYEGVIERIRQIRSGTSY